MEGTGTTSITDLPTDPTGGGSVGGNVALNITETQTQQPSVGQGQGQRNIELDQNTINMLVNGLQKVALTGGTMLPSRDIPQSTDGLVNDPNITPNYIPPNPNVDYINDSETNQIIMDSYNKKAGLENSLDTLYDEIQTPLLLGILYFIFQLPIFKQTMFKYFSFMCNKDGNYNLNGYFLTSILFGLLYYLLTKSMKQFSKF
jgi:hypothetical protein